MKKNRYRDTRRMTGVFAFCKKYERGDKNIMGTITVLAIIIYIIVAAKRNHDAKIKRMMKEIPGIIPYDMYRTRKGKKIYRRDTIRQYKARKKI